MKAAPAPKQRFLIPRYLDDHSTVQITGAPRSYSLEYNAEYGSIPSVTLRCEILDGVIETIDRKSGTLWDRFILWLESCPLIRRPETVAYPVL